LDPGCLLANRLSAAPRTRVLGWRTPGANLAERAADGGVL